MEGGRIRAIVVRRWQWIGGRGRAGEDDDRRDDDCGSEHAIDAIPLRARAQGRESHVDHSRNSRALAGEQVPPAGPSQALPAAFLELSGLLGTRRSLSLSLSLSNEGPAHAAPIGLGAAG